MGKEKKVRMCLSLDERVCGVVERLAAEECRSKSAWVNAALLRVFALVSGNDVNGERLNESKGVGR